MTTPSSLSVIISNYNHGHFIAEAIEAIARQSLPPSQFIIIDDGSTDDSLSIIEDKSKKYPFIRVLRNERNLGSGVSVEKALAEATGDYVYFGASDDRVLPGLFETSVDLLDQNPQAGACTALVSLMDDQGQDLGPKPSLKALRQSGFVSPAQALSLLRKHDAWFNCNTAIYRRESLADLGGFDPELQTFCDAFACTVMALGDGICFIPEYLAVVRAGNQSQSAEATSDADTAIAMFGHARKLMTDKYGALFPTDYVSLWDARWRYVVGRNLLERDGLSALEAFPKLLPGLNGLDLMVIRFLAMIDKGARHLVRYFLLFRLTPTDLLRALINRF